MPKYDAAHFVGTSVAHLPQGKLNPGLPICYDAPTMARPMSEDQRVRFAEKIMDWGNLVFVGTALESLKALASSEMLSPLA